MIATNKIFPAYSWQCYLSVHADARARAHTHTHTHTHAHTHTMQPSSGGVGGSHTCRTHTHTHARRSVLGGGSETNIKINAHQSEPGSAVGSREPYHDSYIMFIVLFFFRFKSPLDVKTQCVCGKYCCKRQR